jgi:hypothetical protein
MTETQTAPEAAEREPFSDLAERPEIKALVTQGMTQVTTGKMTLADLFQAIAAKPDPAVPDKKPPVPLPLNEKQKEALKRLPDVFGKVIVTADRALTKAERAALVEERQVIDTLLAPLKARKEESIREVLANDLDNHLTDEQKAEARRDTRGHYAVKQEIAAEGTGLKVQRSVAGGKPTLTIRHIEALHVEGKIDRPTYLAITKKPDLPRVMDEDGLHKAIQKDPRLFFLLGSVAEPTTPTTTIKVVNDK